MLIANNSAFLRERMSGDTAKTELVCLDFNSGKELWRIPNIENGAFHSYQRGFIFTTGVLDKTSHLNLHAYSAENGKHLWTSRTMVKRGNSVAVFYIKKNIWVYEILPIDSVTGRYLAKASAQDSARLSSMGYIALDPETGKRKAIDRGVWKDFGRCGPDFAADSIILGVDLAVYDMTAQKTWGCNMIRADCGISYLVANGGRYAVGNCCACLQYIHGTYCAISYPLPALDSLANKVEATLVKGPAFGRFDKANPAAMTDWPMYRSTINRSGATKAKVPETVAVRWRVKPAKVISQPVAAAGMVFVAAPDQDQVIALDAKNGSIKWTYTAGGRVNTPPTVIGGQVFFGSADGWLHACDAHTGAIAWKMRLAPADRRFFVRGRLEGLYPLHGTVIIDKGTIYTAAGRHGDADGGIFLYAIDPSDARILWRQRISASPPQRTDVHDLSILRRKDAMEMSFHNDILISDGKTLYIDALGFHLETKTCDAQPEGAAIYGNVPTLLWDNTQFTTGFSVRFHWYMCGAKWGNRKRHMQDYRLMNANVISFDSVLVYGIRHSEYLNAYTKSDSNRTAEVFAVRASGNRDTTIDGKVMALPAQVWSAKFHTGNIRLKALSVASDKLLIATQPGGALLGHGNTVSGELWLMSANDGTLLKKLTLGSEPLFDGIAAGNDGIFVSMKNGDLYCLR
jgi:outer membrane protein assembly factor BamB